MIVNVIVEHSISPGREMDTLRLIRELNGGRFGCSASNPADMSRPRFEVEKKENTDEHRERLDSLSQLCALSDAPARIRVRMSA